jgi:hypothetical protein
VAFVFAAIRPPANSGKITCIGNYTNEEEKSSIKIGKRILCLIN